MKKILGVGTALVDIIAQVDEEIIRKLNLNKGSMSLIEENQIPKIREYFNNPTITSGGSVCNTIHELNNSVHQASFFGKVNDEADLHDEQRCDDPDHYYLGFILFL